MTDIQELFGIDPMNYTKEGDELNQIIAHARRQYASYHQAQVAAKSPTRKAPAKKKAEEPGLPGFEVKL